MTLTLAAILGQVELPDDPFQDSPYRSIASLRNPRDKNALATSVARVYLESEGHSVKSLTPQSLSVDDKEHLVRVSSSPSGSAQWSSLYQDRTHSHYLLLYFMPTKGFLWKVPRQVIDTGSKPVTKGSPNYTFTTAIQTKKGVWQNKHLLASS